MLDTSVNEIDLTQMLRTLWQGKLWIILTVVVAVLIGGYYAFAVATPLYTANSVVMLDNREEQVVDIESVMTGLSGDQATINTEVEVIRSRGLIEKLVIKLDLVNDPEFNELLKPEPRFSLRAIARFVVEIKNPVLSERAILDETMDRLIEKLSVVNIRQSYVFNITAISENPVKSADIANTLAELYILDQLVVKHEATQTATVWLTERVAQLQVELETSESAVKSFISGTNLIGPRSLDALNVQLKELRERLSKTEQSWQSADRTSNELRSVAIADDPAQLVDIAKDPTLTRLFTSLNVDDIATRNAFDARLTQILEGIDLNKARIFTQIAPLKGSVSNLQDLIASQSDDLVALQQLQREAEAGRLIYEYFLGRLKETSVQQGIQQADSRILSRAVIPLKASAPRRLVILVISAFLGALLGSSFVALRELTQNTFRTAEDLERRTGHTVMGQIPMIPLRKRKKVLKYLTDKPASAAAEAIRNLRTSVLLSNVDAPPKIIMSTSSIPGEGKTTQSIALAQNLSGLGKKVLLVEGDLRRRIFTEYFDIKGKKGLLSILSGEAKLQDVVVYNDDLRADILTGEKSAINAADVFSSDKFHAFLADIRNHYDYVILDTPPVLAVPDARIIGQSVDAILYTVKWDSTSHRQVLEGMRSLESVGAKISGFVLAQISTRGMKRYGHGESYGSYSDYYDS
ncbi:MAG: polysaccharide biosynthesis tyrosine autokinase [Marinosulfonomonas sp.]|nr:polysaccharide biosynthesis tyrosine autokinase [Marinosulfonomonas sp.]